MHIESTSSPEIGTAPDLGVVVALSRATAGPETPAALLTEIGAALRVHLGCRRVSVLRPDPEGEGWETVATGGGPEMVTGIASRELPAPAAVSADEIVRETDGSVAVALASRHGGTAGLLRLSPPRGGWATEPSDQLLLTIAAIVTLALEGAEARAALVRQARSDPLTGLGNRSGFSGRLEDERGRARRYRSPLSAIVLDLDNFKAVNDRMGHLAGDDVLVRTAATIRNTLRSIDYAARLGGDEFGLVLPETDSRAAVVLAERLRAAVRTMPGAEQLRLTASLGVATLNGDEDADTLLHRADVAMYAAKAAGRNRCSLHPNEERDLTVFESPELDEVDVLTVRALVVAVDAKDAYTHHHSRRVGALAAATARELGLGERTVRYLQLAGVLHDVGKIGISNQVLTKAGKLTDSEWLELRAHVHVGERILRGVGLSSAAAWVRHHHERFDGAGYPDGLAGDTIPLASRVLLVADAFDAMVSDRAYRMGIRQQAALAEIAKMSGSQFDPDCAAALARALGTEPGLVLEEGYEGLAI